MKILNLIKIILLSTILLPILNASAGLNKLDLKVATKGCAKNDLGFCATLARNGDLKAALKIADLSEDKKLKSDWYAFACDKGEAIGCENLCTKKLSSEKYDMDGCMKMAEFEGKKTPSSEPTGEQFKWWFKACDNGNLDGCAMAGLNTKDPSESSRLLNLACDKENFRACNVLGFRAREKGNLEKANFHYATACRGKYEDSCEILKEIQKEIEDIKNKNAEMAEKARRADLQAKLAPLKAACDSGDLEECIMYGKTMETPAEQKIPWFKKACDGGVMWGCNELASAFYDLNNFNEAIKYYILVCNENKNAVACNNAGWCAQKLNKPADAKKYYLIGCNLDDGDSCESLGDIESKKGNQAEATKFYIKGCGLESSEACNNLASIQIDYNNIAEARKYLNEACDSGSNAACQKLVALTKEFK